MNCIPCARDPTEQEMEEMAGECDYPYFTPISRVNAFENQSN